ncbi:MAG: hypothetical protein DME86_08605 [Verrucomicrobia bacterium]|nr:MAG: hypothetical protein DME86_08605 [Verrucomicrobiota bacterium]
MAKKSDKNIWRGLQTSIASALSMRNYSAASFAERLATVGVEAGQIIATNQAELGDVWIPSVEIFPRTIHFQRHRGIFGELVRRDEGVLAKLKFWPKQWAAARMFANSAKGFHVHPPYIPAGEDPAKWLRGKFSKNTPATHDYEAEQWDVMFFLQGRVEMILRDVRAGLLPRIMRFFIDGDNHRSASNVGVVIPPGVAHALRVEGSEDAIMVYGTSTTFRPEFEGRIASEIETAQLPDSWKGFLAE